MKPLIGFIKTTLIGGLLVVFPTAVVFVLLDKAVFIIHPFLSPVTSRLPDGLPFPGLVAFTIESTAVFFGCFIIGALVRTRTGQQCRLGLEKAFFE